MTADPLTLIDHLRVFQSGDRRAPHKPLLLLLALAALRRGERWLAFDEVRDRLNPLLVAYAPPVKARHQPELPYWHLQSDGIWVVEGAGAMLRQAGGFPRMGALRASHAGLAGPLAEALLASPCRAPWTRPYSSSASCSSFTPRARITAATSFSGAPSRAR